MKCLAEYLAHSEDFVRIGHNWAGSIPWPINLKQFIFLQSLLWTMFLWQICLLCPLTPWTVLTTFRSFSAIKNQSSLKIKCCIRFISCPLPLPPFPPSSPARLVTQGTRSDQGVWLALSFLHPPSLEGVVSFLTKPNSSDHSGSWEVERRNHELFS